MKEVITNTAKHHIFSDKIIEQYDKNEKRRETFAPRPSPQSKPFKIF